MSLRKRSVVAFLIFHSFAAVIISKRSIGEVGEYGLLRGHVGKVTIGSLSPKPSLLRRGNNEMELAKLRAGMKEDARQSGHPAHPAGVGLAADLAHPRTHLDPLHQLRQGLDARHQTMEMQEDYLVTNSGDLLGSRTRLFAKRPADRHNEGDIGTSQGHFARPEERKARRTKGMVNSLRLSLDSRRPPGRPVQGERKYTSNHPTGKPPDARPSPRPSNDNDPSPPAQWNPGELRLQKWGIGLTAASALVAAGGAATAAGVGVYSANQNVRAFANSTVENTNAQAEISRQMGRSTSGAEQSANAASAQAIHAGAMDPNGWSRLPNGTRVPVVPQLSFLSSAMMKGNPSVRNVD